VLGHSSLGDRRPVVLKSMAHFEGLYHYLPVACGQKAEMEEEILGTAAYGMGNR
jgi:hypothetical protein